MSPPEAHSVTSRYTPATPAPTTASAIRQRRLTTSSCYLDGRPCHESPSAYDGPNADLPPLGPPGLDAVDRGRRGVGDAGDRLRPLLLVPDLLRCAAGRVRVVARVHRGGILDLIDRSGDALARGGNARGPAGGSTGDARRGVPAQRRLRVVEPPRIAVVALRRDGRPRRGGGVRGQLDPERSADRAVVHHPAEQHDGPSLFGDGCGRAGR